MPKIARVRLSDGRVARFRVPDDATPEQIKAAVSRKMAGEKRSGGALGFLNNAVSSLNQAAIGAVEGVHNIASAVTDPIAGAVFGDDAVEAANRGRRKVVDTVESTIAPTANPVARTGGRIGGAIAATPLRAAQAASVVGRGAIRALQGAAGGAGVREVDDSALAPAATGAAAGVVLPPALSWLARTAPAQAVGNALSRATAPVIGAVDDAAEAALPHINALLGRQHVPLRGMPAPAPRPPLEPLGRKAQARAARFKSVGVDRPTTGMVARDPAAFSFERNIAKVQGVGDDLAQQMRDVESRLVETGRNLVRAHGGAKGSEATGRNVGRALDAKRNEMQRVTSGIYKQVRDQRGDEAVGRLDSFRETLTDPDLVDNPVFDQMRQAIVNRLTRYGVIGRGVVTGKGLSKFHSPSGASSFSTSTGSVGRPATIKQAEELRKFIGGLGNNMEPATRMMRAKLIEALDDDVVNAVGDDAFKAARASAKARFEEFQKTFPGKLADEKLAPELLTKRVLGDGVKMSDLRSLRLSLTTGTPEQIARGREAWRDLQAQSLDDLLGKSVDADGNLVGTVLWREFSKNAAKYREILGPADFKTLRRLAAASRDAKAFPVGHSVNTSNTAVTSANLFSNAPPAVRDGWGKLLGKVGLRAGAHIGAAALGGPAGNLAVEGVRSAGSAVAATKAQEAAARALIQKVRMAQSPEAAAAAIREAQEAGASNPIVADALKKAGLNVVVGGASAAPQ